MGCGFIAFYEETPEVALFSGSEFFPESPQNSNNVAEYKALIFGLERLLSLGLADACIEVRGDSNLVIQQMSGNWQVKDGLYKPSAIEAVKLSTFFSNISYRFVRRELNTLADELSRANSTQQ